MPEAGAAEAKTKQIRVGKRVPTRREAAVCFYHLINDVYNCGLTDREIELLAHTALWGTITTPPAKKEFMKVTGTTRASLNNMLSKLQKRSFLVKDEQHKIRLNPKIRMGFSGDSYEFRIIVTVEEAGQDDDA